MLGQPSSSIPSNCTKYSVKYCQYFMIHLVVGTRNRGPTITTSHSSGWTGCSLISSWSYQQLSACILWIQRPNRLFGIPAKLGKQMFYTPGDYTSRPQTHCAVKLTLMQIPEHPNFAVPTYPHQSGPGLTSLSRPEIQAAAPDIVARGFTSNEVLRFLCRSSTGSNQPNRRQSTKRSSAGLVVLYLLFVFQPDLCYLTMALTRPPQICIQQQPYFSPQNSALLWRPNLITIPSRCHGRSALRSFEAWKTGMNQRSGAWLHWKCFTTRLSPLPTKVSYMQPCCIPSIQLTRVLSQVSKTPENKPMEKPKSLAKEVVTRPMIRCCCSIATGGRCGAPMSTLIGSWSIHSGILQIKFPNLVLILAFDFPFRDSNGAGEILGFIFGEHPWVLFLLDRFFFGLSEDTSLCT